MNFRVWYNEWEGNAFPGDSSQYVNDDRYPNSKWQGHGNSNSWGAPSYMNNVEKMYKLKPPIVVKRMKKKV